MKPDVTHPRGFFGTSTSLEARDFQTSASKGSLMPQSVGVLGSVYRVILPTDAFPWINVSTSNAGLTQLRLRFKLDDNNDAIANYISFFSGDYATSSARPTLVITYYVP